MLWFLVVVYQKYSLPKSAEIAAVIEIFLPDLPLLCGQDL